MLFRSKRFEKVSGTSYVAVSSSIFLIFMIFISRNIVNTRPFQFILIGTVIAGAIMSLKIYSFTRYEQLYTFFIKATRVKYLTPFLLFTGALFNFLSSLSLFRTSPSVGVSDSMFMFFSMTLLLFSAYYIGNGEFPLGKILKGDGIMKKRTYLSRVLPLLLTGIPFAFYFLRSWWMPVYFYELTPGLCMASAVTLVALFKGTKDRMPKNRKRKKESRGGEGGWKSRRWFPKWFKSEKGVFGSKSIGRVSISAFLVLSLILPVRMFATDPYGVYLKDPGQHPSVSVVREISHIIETNTEPEEEIFAWPVFAFQSDRNIVFNITHPLLYKEYIGEDEGKLEEFGYPTVRQIMERLEEKVVRFVVVDSNIEQVFFSHREYFREYIHAHYTTVFEHGGIEVKLRAE